MEDFVETLKGRIPSDCFADAELAGILEGTANRRHALVKRSIAAGDLISVRRGLYCLGEKYRRKSLDLFALAQRIYGPSYVSLESALSFHGWIPDGVFSVTSVSMKRSVEFKTPFGVFAYHRIPSNPFLEGVERHETEAGAFFMASPWKALADYVYIYKKNWRSSEPLKESLRIEKEFFRSIPVEELHRLRQIYKSLRVQNFFQGIIKELA